MGLFRRNRPLHEQLANAAEEPVARPPLESYLNPHLSSPARSSLEPPVYAERPTAPEGMEPAPASNWWHPDPASRPAHTPLDAHGPLATRPWDVVVTADAPLLRGDHLAFVTLPDGTAILEDDQPEGALAPLADAVEASIPPPYRAAAVRNHESLWGVSAVRIRLVRIPELVGDTAELIVNGSEPALTIDGRPARRRVEELERVGESEGRTYVVRAARVDEDLWQVDALPL